MLGTKKHTLLTVLLVIGGLLVFYTIHALKPAPKARPVARPPAPEVTAQRYRAADHSLWITTQGVVSAKTEIDLVAQVAGKVTAVSDNFASGGYFLADEVLIEIDDADFRIAQSRAKAEVADAAQALASERGRERQARREWRDLGDKAANDLFLRKPQLASAQAALQAAEAGVRKARLDLQRTRISLPFNGRVLKKHVDIGQYLSPGAVVARVYGTDIAELRLPLTPRQRALLGTALDDLSESPLPVTLSITRGEDEEHWPAQLVRAEGELDRSSRQLFVIARIDDPFRARDGRRALVVGQFVSAKIHGGLAQQSFRIPRSALRQRQQLWLADEEGALRIIAAEVVQSDGDSAIVRVPNRRELRLVLSELSLPIEGMSLAVVERPAVADRPQATVSAAGDLPATADSQD